MRSSRVYVDAPLESGAEQVLPPASAHYVARVLRLRVDSPVVVFNGRGGEFEGHISSLGRHGGSVRIGVHRALECESPLRIELAQAISRGERMDYTLQKSVELGVSRIVPLQTERSVVRLDDTRAERRILRWREIVIHACEQCGRNRVPDVASVTDLQHWLGGGSDARLKLLLNPDAERSLSDIDATGSSIALLIGAEGGFSEDERDRAVDAGFLPVCLGPRVLRTETAAVAALAALQARFGDL